VSLKVVANRASARPEVRGVHVQTDLPVAMRDGATPRADVYSSVAGGPYPCVLYRTPYGKTGTFGPAELAESFAARGYTVVAQDIRGRLAWHGHRVRIDISSSDFPNHDRNHNTGGNDWQEAELRTARQRVSHDANRASCLRLPTIRS
jgi:predicted acyl esterase